MFLPCSHILLKRKYDLMGKRVKLLTMHVFFLRNAEANDKFVFLIKKYWFWKIFPCR